MISSTKTSQAARKRPRLDMQALRQTQTGRQSEKSPDAEECRASQRPGGAWLGVEKSRGWAVKLSGWELRKKQQKTSPDGPMQAAVGRVICGHTSCDETARRVVCTHKYIGLVLGSHAALVGNRRLGRRSNGRAAGVLLAQRSQVAAALVCPPQ